MKSMRRYRRFLSTDDWEEYSRKEFQTDQRDRVPTPPRYKPYPGNARLVDLVPPDEFTVGWKPLYDVIAERESRRKFTADPLTLEELSFLLWATHGLRKPPSKGGKTRPSFRMVPSGGGRHPLETYLVINRVTGLDAGLYRYLPSEHKLLFIRTDDQLAGKIAVASFDQKFVADGAVIFVWTTVPYRAEWRYSIVAHKMIAQDSGHLCQNLYLAAEAIDAGTCAIGAYHQKPLDELIGVDGEDEFVIYLAPVGKPA